MVGEVKEELKQLRIDFDTSSEISPAFASAVWSVGDSTYTAINSVDSVGTKAVLAEVHRTRIFRGET